MEAYYLQAFALYTVERYQESFNALSPIVNPTEGEDPEIREVIDELKDKLAEHVSVSSTQEEDQEMGTN